MQGPLGGELSGRVVAVGAEVAEFGVGDEVVGLATGAFARRVNVLATLLARKPERMSPHRGGDRAGGLLHGLAGLAAGRLAGRAAGADSRCGRRGGPGRRPVGPAPGAEVFATASEPKQDYLRSLGVHASTTRAR